VRRIRSVFLAFLCFSVMLILATGCFRPAAADVTPTPAEDGEGATPGEPDLEATAKANSTQAARTLEAQTAEAGTPEEEEEEEEEEPVATSTEPAATATPEPPTATPVPVVSPTTPAPTPVPTATEEPTAGETTYVVQPGDNLFRIAMRYGTTWEAIAQANGITDVTQVYVGQELVIPAGAQPDAPPSQPSPGGTTYVVKPGDNLFRIALRYNMDYRRLAAYNGIANPSNIYVGQVLRIPPQ